MGKVTKKGPSVATKQMKSGTLQKKQTPRPLFTPQKRYEKHEKWSKRKQTANKPGLIERATGGIFEYFDPTPDYRPNAGDHMMSVATDANDIVTLLRNWDLLKKDGKVTQNQLFQCKKLVIHLVTHTVLVLSIVYSR